MSLPFELRFPWVMASRPEPHVVERREVVMGPMGPGDVVEPDDFYVDDEPLEDVRAAFGQGTKAVTWPPGEPLPPEVLQAILEHEGA